MTRTLTALVSLPAMPEDVRAEYETWLGRYNINPSNVPLGVDFVCDDENNTITYEEAVTDANGDWDHHDALVITRPVTIQLDEPAAPFPSDIPPGYINDWATTRYHVNGTRDD